MIELRLVQRAYAYPYLLIAHPAPHPERCTTTEHRSILDAQCQLLLLRYQVPAAVELDHAERQVEIFGEQGGKRSARYRSLSNQAAVIGQYFDRQAVRKSTRLNSSHITISYAVF